MIKEKRIVKRIAVAIKWPLLKKQYLRAENKQDLAWSIDYYEFPSTHHDGLSEYGLCSQHKMKNKQVFFQIYYSPSWSFYEWTLAKSRVNSSSLILSPFPDIHLIERVWMHLKLKLTVMSKGRLWTMERIKAKRKAFEKKKKILFIAW